MSARAARSHFTKVVLLRELQRELVHSHAYVPLLVLGAVAAKKLEEGVRFSTEPAAHTYFAIVPTARMLNAMPASLPSSARMGASSYAVKARASRAANPWHGALPVLVGEGTARASSFLLPTAAYYAADGEQRVAAAVARAQARAALQRDTVQRGGMPTDLAATEILQSRHVLTPAILADQENVSDFYNVQGSAYLHAFATGGGRGAATSGAPVHLGM